MSNRNGCTTTDVLETRAGIRVLANNEVAAVAGASVWDAYTYGKEHLVVSERIAYAVLVANHK